MRFGIAETDITPRDGMTAMSGYGRRRYARGVVSPLMLGAAVIEDDAGRRHALIAADLLGFDRTTTLLLRHRLAGAGFAPERVMLNASHTHYGPPTQFGFSAAVGPVDPWYIAWMEERALDTVQAACAALAEVELRCGSFPARIGHNRRLRRLTPAPGEADGYDEHAAFLWARPKDSRGQEAVLLAHGCHPVFSGAEGYCADWPGEFRRQGTLRRPGTRFAFLQGCGGDINGPDKEHYVAEGGRLAEDLISQLREETTRIVSGAFACAIQESRLTFGRRFGASWVERNFLESASPLMALYAREHRHHPDTRRCLPYSVQVWRADEFSIIGMEGEVANAYAAVARGMAGGECMVLGYSNAVECYVPTEQILREGGYEAEDSCWAYRLPGFLSVSTPAVIRRTLQRAVDAVSPAGVQGARGCAMKTKGKGARPR
jgi:hypothetical protein